MAGPPSDSASSRETGWFTRSSGTRPNPNPEGYLARNQPSVVLRALDPRILEKSADQIEKGVEPVMMDPMAGVFDRNDPGIAEMASPPVIRRVGGPALLAVD